jgi:hypothetical protein
MNKHRKLAQRQATHIESEVESLRGGHRGLLVYRYRDFVQHAKKINALFKESHAIHHQEQQRLWELFSSLREVVSYLSRNAFERVPR